MSNESSPLVSSTTDDDLPKDVAVAFHTSFHHTQGNTLDWSLTIDDSQYSASLKGVEFSSLPSGLHSVESDIVYFTNDGLDAIASFRRRKILEEEGRRGYHMEAYGLILAQSTYPRPWLHVSALRQVGDRAALEAYFHKSRASPAPSSSASVDWESELSPHPSHPLLQLPRLLRLIGPSFLTIFKYVLARNRILFYTQAPVELAGLLAKCCVDVAFGGQCTEELLSDSANDQGNDSRPLALGTVGLIDIEKLETESKKATGWIACTTDAIFLERPALYDLIMDLTTIIPPVSASSLTSHPLSRPTLYISRPSSTTSSLFKLEQVRFTFSDIRIWYKIDQLLRANSKALQALSPKPSSQVSTWRFYTYEDVCLYCGSLWLSADSSWSSGNSGTGKVRLEGPDEALLEAQPRATSLDFDVITTQPKASGRTPRRLVRRHSSQSSKSTSSASRRERYSQLPPQVSASLLLLDLFHSQAAFWLDGLSNLLDVDSTAKLGGHMMTLSPADMQKLQLSAFSEIDSRFAESLALARFGRRIAVRRSWKDLMAAAVGC